MKTTLKIVAAAVLALVLSGPATSLKADPVMPFCPPLCPNGE